MSLHAEAPGFISCTYAWLLFFLIPFVVNSDFTDLHRESIAWWFSTLSVTPP
ncbi:MAG TPA: hypothetical protein VFV68_04400 [Agriterribacter sp.]|nr:hypothetical protein [Agriterribacter sp.]